MSKYTAEDYITFIEQKRWDKISPEALRIIAKRFRELEETLKNDLQHTHNV